MVSSQLWFCLYICWTSWRREVADPVDSKNQIDNNVSCCHNKASYLHGMLYLFFSLTGISNCSGVYDPRVMSQKRRSLLYKWMLKCFIQIVRLASNLASKVKETEGTVDLAIQDSSCAIALLACLACLLYLQHVESGFCDFKMIHMLSRFIMH